MNMLANILLQVGCVQDLSLIGLCLRTVIQNQNYSKTNLTMPVLALGAGYIPTLGGNTTMPSCQIWDESISSKCNIYDSSKFRTLYSRRAARCRSKIT